MISSFTGLDCPCPYHGIPSRLGKLDIGKQNLPLRYGNLDGFTVLLLIFLRHGLAGAAIHVDVHALASGL